MAQLTPTQIYEYAVGAGFPPDTAVKMTAIALKESSGNTAAFNGKNPDVSYGLWQINMINKPGYELGNQRMQQFGLSDPSDLFDPATNARAAYQIWNGNDANLDRHWYIDRGANKTRYEAFLDQIAGLFGYQSIETGEPPAEIQIEAGINSIPQEALIVAGVLAAVIAVRFAMD